MKQVKLQPTDTNECPCDIAIEPSENPDLEVLDDRQLAQVSGADSLQLNMKRF